MRITTDRWAKFESKGYPKSLQVHRGDVKTLTLALAKWLAQVQMGSRIVITITRTREELDASPQNETVADLEAELSALLDSETAEEPTHG